MSPLRRTGPIKTKPKPCTRGCGRDRVRRGLCAICAWDDEMSATLSAREAERETREAERIAAALAAPSPVMRAHDVARPAGHRPVVLSEIVREPEERVDWTRVTEILLARCGGLCEACGLPLGDETSGLDLKPDRHHRQKRAIGGHGVSNLVMLHHPCHVVGPRAVHMRPEWARGRGLIVSDYDVPAETPLLLPGGRLVLLSEGGAYSDVTETRHSVLTPD